MVLTVDNLVNINYIPDEMEISLQLFVEFYESYLCKRFFVFNLDDGTEVKLFFKDTTEIFHISGIEHIYEGIPMDGTRFVNEVKNGNITFNTLKSINTKKYNDFKVRIRSFSCIDTIIKNCEYLWYPDGEIPDSTIRVTYLLIKGLDGKNLHLGIDAYKANKPYFSRTLLVTDGNTKNKFIDKASVKFRVDSLEIQDKDTKNVIEVVRRKEAAEICSKLIQSEICKWELLELDKLVNDFYMDKLRNINNKEWIGLGERFAISNENEIVDTFLRKIMTSKDISEYIFFYKSTELKEKEEWKEILIVETNKVINNTANWTNCFSETFQNEMNSEIDKIIEILTNQCYKKVLIRALNNTLVGMKLTIKNAITKYDPYWSYRIILENIENEILKYSNSDLNIKFRQIIENRRNEFRNVLTSNVEEQVTLKIKIKLSAKVLQRVLD